MSKKILPILLACAVALFAFFKNKGNQNSKNDKVINEKISPKPKHEGGTDNNNTTTKVKDFGDLRFHNKPVVLTKHAKCRMGCRQIDASEVQEMLNNGVINQRKSGQSKDESTCPTIALEGKTHDAQTVRIVVAECADKAKIVTVIDLKNDFTCDCK
jgi:Domain of unknown function (DUF4258)